MKVYQVIEGDEVEEYHPTKGSAMKHARQLAKEYREQAAEHDLRPHNVEVLEIELVKLNKAGVVACLNGEGFAKEFFTIWSSEKEG